MCQERAGTNQSPIKTSARATADYKSDVEGIVLVDTLEGVEQALHSNKSGNYGWA
jgi:hypothetical protein